MGCVPIRQYQMVFNAAWLRSCRFCILYALQQAGRKDANVVVADLDFPYTVAATLVGSMNIYCVHHVIEDCGRQLVEVQVLLHLLDEAIHVLCLVFLFSNFLGQLVDLYAQLSLSRS